MSIFRAALRIAIIWVATSFTSFSQQIPEAPNPPRLVNDLANVLDDGQEEALEQKLIRYEDSTSNQVAIVLVNSLEGADVADYAVKLALKWGIGSKKDNGVLILAAIADRKIRIEVGYGLEARITDLVSNQIIGDIKPYFRQEQYYEGLNLATTLLAKVAAGEHQGEYQYSKKKNKRGKGIGWGALIVILIILFFVSRGGRGGGGGFLTGMLLGNLLGGSRHSGGGWGDFSSGGGSFGGFGGGSFGGGGSSGDW